MKEPDKLARAETAAHHGSETVPTVSVIVPALNEEELLPRCLDALSRLTGRSKLELIVVDNGSTDRTREIARRSGATVLQSSARTIAAARNEGARAARGSVLAFIDADCLVERDWLENALANFSSPNVVAVGSYPLVEPGAPWVAEAWSFLVRNTSGARKPTAWLPSANMFVLRRVFEQLNGFCESLETCEDSDLSLRLQAFGAVIDDPGVRMKHLREPENLTQFFRRELWHGKNSFNSARRGFVQLAELPSLLSPLIVLLGACLSAFGLARALTNKGWGAFFYGILVVSAPSVLYTVKAVLLKGHVFGAPRFLLIYLTYFMARAVATFHSAMRATLPRRAR